MSSSLSPVLSPHGALRLEPADSEFPFDQAIASRLEKTFARDCGHGLLQLGIGEAGSHLPPALGYWRGFAMHFVSALCTHDESALASELKEIPVPPTGELAALVDEAPPMPGGEYLRTEVLQALWHTMQRAAAVELAESGLPLGEFLRSRDSRWRLVGRVHFNLAENRRDAEFPFAFMATYTSSLAAHGALRHLPLAQALQEYAGVGAKEKLLKLLEPVQQAGESCAWLKEMIDAGEVFHPIRWTPRDAVRFLNDVPVLERSGLVVRMPAAWRMNRPSRPAVEATVGSQAPGAVGVDAMLDFQVEVSLDGEALTATEIESLLASTDGLALLRGKWVEVDPDKLKAALDKFAAIERLAAREGVPFGQAMRLLADAGIGDESSTTDTAQWAHVRAGSWLEETLAGCRKPGALVEARAIEGLNAELRPYQEVGVSWLAFLNRLGLGACLADDMGLGKTVQVLAFLTGRIRKRGRSAPSLIVAPASLLANWAAEAARFTPSLRLFVAHPSFAPPDRLKTMMPGDLVETDVVVTSYGALLRLKWLSDLSWDLVVLDEAQGIKNPNTKQTRVVKTLRAQGRIALTGTPIENNLRDLWSIFDFINPGLLGSSKAFAEFVKKLAAREPVSYAPLRRLAAPYILRRLKTDRRIIADLPDKTEVNAFCCLTKKQAALYQTAVVELKEQLSNAGDGIARRGLVLSSLMRLKQICNHPAQWLGNGDYMQEDSGKFARLSEIAETIASRQEKLLVFTQFKEIIEPIEQALGLTFGRPGLALHGGTAVGKRKELVSKFQDDARIPFFVLSLKAGGTGLNLTAASHVIHFDRWWNPAVESQATDRAFRIGQKRNVLVHKFVCRGTIEERIDKLIESKRELAQGLLGGGEINLTEMNDRELLALVRLDLDAAMKEG